MKAILYLMDRVLTKDLILNVSELVHPHRTNRKTGREIGEEWGAGEETREALEDHRNSQSEAQEKPSWAEWLGKLRWKGGTGAGKDF